MKADELRKDPKRFRQAVLVDTDSGPRPLSHVIDDWQNSDFEALDTGFMKAAGLKPKGKAFSRAWLERGRGHSKSSDAVLMALYVLFASKRQVRMVFAAADKDQAKINRDHAERIVSDNPWMADELRVDAWKIVNVKTGSECTVISSDVASSWGLLVDVILMDEVSVWAKRDLFDSLLSTAGKRGNCMLACCTNAGWIDSWTWETREKIREDESWYFHALPGPVASWITEDRLAEQERLLPRIAFERIWLNLWASGGGDLLPGELIDRAFHSELKPMTGSEENYRWCAGLDIGLKRDASAFVVLGIGIAGTPTQTRIRLAHSRIWKPVPGTKVNLNDVMSHILEIDRRFRGGIMKIGFDPWQAEKLAQDLEVLAGNHSSRKGPLLKSNPKHRNWMVELPPTSSVMRDAASLLIQAFNDNRLDLFDDGNLKRDLYKARIEERGQTSGSIYYRIVSPRDSSGHADTLSAFINALVVGHDLAGKKRIVLGEAEESTWDGALAGFRERQELFDECEREMREWTPKHESNRRASQAIAAHLYPQFYDY